MPSRRMLRSSAFFLVFAWATGPLASAFAGELSVVPLFDGERAQVDGEGMLNNWGGPFGNGNIVGVFYEPSIVRSGNGAYRANLGSIPNGGIGFFQTFSSGFGATSAYRQTRNLEYFETFQGYIRNNTGTPFTLKLELKDFRDSLSHQANRSYSIPAGGGWTKIEAPLDFGPGGGWNVVGTPDFERTFAISYVVDATNGPVSGAIYLDDFELVEPGGAVDIQTAPIETLVERLARRQFDGLWSARSRAHGLIPNVSHKADVSAMNTTAGVLWMLPAAVRRGWVVQADADAYVSQVVGTLDSILNTTNFVPSRFVDLTTGGPGANWEESSIDAAFVALALHNYKSQSATPQALYNTIDAVQNRFDFAAFDNGVGFRLAYFPSSGFSGEYYNGYTNEGKIISVAAELSDNHHVPLEDRWNADTARVRTSLVDPDDAHLVHSLDLFRAPFAQALFNLFVDTSDRGVDNFGNRTLATNPWQNYVRYEREIAAKLAQQGRDDLFQPDAARGGPPQGYKPYSLYNDYGQPDLLMPWSVTLAMLAGADGADDALRTLLDAGLHGPLGLADSARWTTGENGPFDVPAYQDNWNVVLSTMALLEILDRQEGNPSASRFFASLAELDSALDMVFVDGDLSGNGLTDAADLSIWEMGFGDVAGATPTGGDVDGDGDVDGFDFLRWQRGLGHAATSVASATEIPEPTTIRLVCLSVFLGNLLSARRRAGRFSFENRAIPRNGESFFSEKTATKPCLVDDMPERHAPAG